MVLAFLMLSWNMRIFITEKPRKMRNGYRRCRCFFVNFAISFRIAFFRTHMNSYFRVNKISRSSGILFLNKTTLFSYKNNLKTLSLKFFQKILKNKLSLRFFFFSEYLKGSINALNQPKRVASKGLLES